MPPSKSHRTLKGVTHNSVDDGGVFLPKEGLATTSTKVGRHWEKIFKRGDKIREAIGAFTPSVGSITDRNRHLDNAFKKNRSVQQLPKINTGGLPNLNVGGNSRVQHLHSVMEGKTGAFSTRNTMNNSTMEGMETGTRDKFSPNNWLIPLSELR